MKMKSIEMGSQRIIGKKVKRKISPPDLWEYCVQHKLPYIIVCPAIKYSKVSYDLMTINKGLRFKDGHSFSDLFEKLYDEYVSKSSLPKHKVYFLGGERFGDLVIFKKDQDEIISLFFEHIEAHIGKYGIYDASDDKYFTECEESVKRARARDRYLESLNSNK